MFLIATCVSIIAVTYPNSIVSAIRINVEEVYLPIYIIIMCIGRFFWGSIQKVRFESPDLGRRRRVEKSRGKRAAGGHFGIDKLDSQAVFIFYF